jgi:hypothetical protein
MHARQAFTHARRAFTHARLAFMHARQTIMHARLAFIHAPQTIMHARQAFMHACSICTHESPVFFDHVIFLAFYSFWIRSQASLHFSPGNNEILFFSVSSVSSVANFIEGKIAFILLVFFL